MNVVLTDGSQPIGNGVGPVLEMQDVIRVLKRENSPKDLENKSIFLAAEILEMVSKAKKGNGEQMAREALYSGRAYKKFEEIISAQGKIFTDLKPAKFTFDITAKNNGKISLIDNRSINLLGRILGCPADKTAGLYLYKHNLEAVKKGDKLLTLYSESEKKLDEAIRFFSESKPIQIE